MTHLALRVKCTTKLQTHRPTYAVLLICKVAVQCTMTYSRFCHKLSIHVTSAFKETFDVKREIRFLYNMMVNTVLWIHCGHNHRKGSVMITPIEKRSHIAKPISRWTYACSMLPRERICEDFWCSNAKGEEVKQKQVPLHVSACLACYTFPGWFALCTAIMNSML